MYNFDLKRFCELCYGETLNRIIDEIVSKERELDGIERTQAKKKKSATDAIARGSVKSFV